MSNYVHTRRSEDGDGFFCRFTFGQFFALLILEVFTLFFVFYLGARYGREFLGLGQPKDMAAAEETADVVPERKVMTTADPEAREAVRELIAQAKTPELKDRIRQMIEGAHGKEAEEPKVIERNLAGEREEAEEKAKAEEEAQEAGVQEKAAVEGEAEQPPPKQEEKRQGLSTEEIAAASDSSVIRVKSADNARYSVQIGSYSTMKEATSIIEKWKTKGYPAYMMIADVPDRGRWYRVRLGGFETRGDAAKYMKELQTRENVEALVVLNEQ